MITLLAQTVMALLAVTDPFYGDIPKGVPTFNIHLDSGTVTGALNQDGEWITDQTPTINTANRPDIVLDTPWQPQRMRMPFRTPEFEAVASAVRDDSLRTGWADAGYEIAIDCAREHGLDLPSLD